jgi:hypothetical protein
MEPLQGCAAFPHLAATFTREVEAGQLSVIVMQATCTESHRSATLRMSRMNEAWICQRRLHRTVLFF